MAQGQPGFDTASSSSTNGFQPDIQVIQRLKAINQELEAIDQNFEVIVQNLETVDQNFRGLDQKLEAVDQKFEAIDQKLEAIRRRNERKSKKSRRQLRRQFRRIDRWLPTTINEEVLRRLSALEFRANNSDIRAGNSRHLIQPLTDLRTGDIIPNCPTTIKEVMELSTEEADRILLALRTPLSRGVIGTLSEKQEAVRLALLP